MVESKLTYLTIEQGTELSAVFKNLGFHQYQDPLRSVFVHQPCYTYSVDGTVVAFAILELHRLKKASIWLGPVFNSEINKDLIWDDFFKQLRKFGIGHLTLQPEKDDVFNSAINYINGQRRVKIIRIQKGMSTAIKKLVGIESDLINTYNKHHQKEVRIAEKNDIHLFNLSGQEDFEKLATLFLLMFRQKHIHHYPAVLKARLRGECDYIAYSGNGKVTLAEKNGQIVGASIEIYGSESSYYVFGATDKRIKLPVSYWILHNSFKALITKQTYYFDFGGYQQDEPDIQFAKVGKFKEGFGVEIKKYPDCLVINTGRMDSKLIEVALILRNKLLKSLGKHTS